MRRINLSAAIDRKNSRYANDDDDEVDQEEGGICLVFRRSDARISGEVLRGLARTERQTAVAFALAAMS